MHKVESFMPIHFLKHTQVSVLHARLTFCVTFGSMDHYFERLHSKYMNDTAWLVSVSNLKLPCVLQLASGWFYMMNLCCPLQSLRRRMRPGQRPPSRFQAEAAESQAQADSEPPQLADTSAADAANLASLVAAWDPLELSSMMRQVSPAGVHSLQ